MHRILVLGSTGNIGHQVYYRLKNRVGAQVYDVSFRRKLTDDTELLDVTDSSALEYFVRGVRPDYIINCMGVLREGSRNIENAIFMNAYLPHRLASLAHLYNSKLIHISTDCVFSGSKGKYIESDDKDGLGLYAETKSLGEVIDSQNLTLRTSTIGPELKENGEGLFHWFMNQKEAAQGFTGAVWSGVTTIQLARAVDLAITSDATGLHHVTNNSSISKFELLLLLKKYTGKEITIHPVEGSKSDKSFIDTRCEINFQIPTYDEMIVAMVADIRANERRYTYQMS